MNKVVDRSRERAGTYELGSLVERQALRFHSVVMRARVPLAGHVRLRLHHHALLHLLLERKTMHR